MILGIQIFQLLIRIVFIETPIFTKLTRDLLSDDYYRNLQRMLLLRPDAGDIIQGSGGLRKIRWNIPGHGKRGGLRIIYYWMFLMIPYTCF